MSTMLYAACPEIYVFHSMGGGGLGWGTRPPLNEVSGSARDKPAQILKFTTPVITELSTIILLIYNTFNFHYSTLPLHTCTVNFPPF